MSFATLADFERLKELLVCEQSVEAPSCNLPHAIHFLRLALQEIESIIFPEQRLFVKRAISLELGRPPSDFLFPCGLLWTDFLRIEHLHIIQPQAGEPAL